MNFTYKYLLLIFCLFQLSCDKEINDTQISKILRPGDINILSLGDSYTIGQGVCETCKYPEILKEKIKTLAHTKDQVALRVIAKTGWTTSRLIVELDNSDIGSNHDIVTLLIGVNNQYLNGSFSVYEKEMPELIEKAVDYASGNKNNVIIISIPDYAYTPFGQNWVPDPGVISDELDTYNNFAQSYCLDNGISFVNITDISREGLENTSLVASDDLHPSSLAHLRFADRVLPIIIEKLR